MIDNPRGEECVLGALILDGASWIAHARDRLAPQDFTHEGRAAAFRTMLALHDLGKPTDLVHLAPAMPPDMLDMLGGVAGLVEMAETVPTAANFPQYCELVSNAATCRALHDIGGALVAQSRSLGVGSGADAAHAAQEAIQRVLARSRDRGVARMPNLATEAHRALLDDSAQSEGLPTGFHQLDKMLSGLRPGSLYVVAGRPAMGKSSFATSILAGLAERGRFPRALLATLEVSAEQVAHNMLLGISGIPNLRAVATRLGEGEKRQLEYALDLTQRMEVAVDDTPGLSIPALRSKALAEASEGGLDLLIVDYLQLLTPGREEESRQVEISRMSGALKQLARELDCPVVALSQLNRLAETRKDKRPMLADLRESGSIEQDADAVLLLYREAYYYPEKLGAENGATIIVAKNRIGPTGDVEIRFEPQTARFTE